MSPASPFIYRCCSFLSHIRPQLNTYKWKSKLKWTNIRTTEVSMENNSLSYGPQMFNPIGPRILLKHAFLFPEFWAILPVRVKKLIEKNLFNIDNYKVYLFWRILISLKLGSKINLVLWEKNTICVTLTPDKDIFLQKKWQTEFSWCRKKNIQWFDALHTISIM